MSDTACVPAETLLDEYGSNDAKKPESLGAHAQMAYPLRQV
jgi:hypothetical protein